MRVAARGGVSSSTTRKEGLLVLFMSEEGKFISFFSQMERERERGDFAKFCAGKKWQMEVMA